MSRLEQLAPWIAGAIIALPVLLAHYPPMADLPLHEAVAGLLRHWNDQAFAPRSVYELHLGHANQLFYFLIAGLAYVVPIGAATRIVVTAALLFLPISAARVADHLGVTRWTAVVVAPIGLGWLFFWGLLANLIGLDLFLCALPALDRFCERPSRRGLLLACAWLVLLHFAHDLIALMAGGTLVLFTLCTRKGWRENALRLAPTALILGISVVTRILALEGANRHHNELPAFYWYPLAHKLLTLPGALYAGYEWWVRDLIFLVCAVPMALFGLERWRHRSIDRPFRFSTWLHERRFEALAGFLLLGYFAAPMNMRSTTLIYHRFIAPSWILLSLTAGTRAKLDHPWRLPRLLAAIVPFVPLFTSWPAFVDSDRVYTELDDAATHMERNSTYIVLELGPSKRDLLYQPLTGGGHLVAELGGRGFFDFTQSPQSPVTQKLSVEWVEIFERLDGHSYRLMPEHDLRRFRYAILHTWDLGIADGVTAALAPYARFVHRSGEWTVLESRLPLVPIYAPDEPLPKPRPKTLRRLVLELREELLKEAPDDDPTQPTESVPAPALPSP